MTSPFPSEGCDLGGETRLLWRNAGLLQMWSGQVMKKPTLSAVPWCKKPSRGRVRRLVQ